MLNYPLFSSYKSYTHTHTHLAYATPDLPPSPSPPCGAGPGALCTPKYLFEVRINTFSIPFSGRGPTIATLRLQQAHNVYKGQPVSTDYRPPSPYTRATDVSKWFLGKDAFGPLPKYSGPRDSRPGSLDFFYPEPKASVS